MRRQARIFVVAILLVTDLAAAFGADVDRTELKKALKEAGYYHDNVNKAHPKEVEAAIKRYEQDHGWPVTGQVSEPLLEQLGLAKPVPSPATPNVTPAPQLNSAATDRGSYNASPARPVVIAPTTATSYPSTLPLPSIQLSPFMNGQLGAVLAPLDHNVNAPRQQAVELREKFADEMAMVSEPEKPVFKQAVMVVEMIIGAMDERENALTEARHSSMPGAQDTHDARVSVNGRHGHAAVKSERMENNQSKQAAQQKSEFLEEGAVKQWADRSNVLRQTIDRAYAVERNLERR